MLRTIPLAILLATTATIAPAADTLITKLEALAKTGNAKALYHLGMSYQTGTGVTQDHVRALAYFRDAAAKGDPLAAYKLGCFYAGQDNVIPVEIDQALKYKLIAAKAGYALAQSDVAGMLAYQGDVRQAEAWMEKAAAQGTRDALIGEAVLHSGRMRLPRDPFRMALYLTLYIARTGGTEQQKTELDSVTSELSDTDLVRLRQSVAEYQPRPTDLTIEALSGSRAAAALVAKP